MRRKQNFVFLFALLMLTFFLLFFTFNIRILQATLVVPTNEWQEIMDGDSVPAGNIHVKMDLTTGKRFAKIKEREDRNIENELRAVEMHDKIEDLQTKPKFRTLEEIRKEFAQASSLFESETSIVQKLTKKLEVETRYEIIVEIMNELEGLVHGIDNAKLFADYNGLEHVLRIIKNLNNSIVIFTSIGLAGIKSNAVSGLEPGSGSGNELEKLVNVEYIKGTGNELGDVVNHPNQNPNPNTNSNKNTNQNLDKMVSNTINVIINENDTNNFSLNKYSDRTPQDDFNLVCLPLIRLLFASLQNNYDVQRRFSSLGGVDSLGFILKHAQKSGNSACLKKGASAVSAALRGCDKCVIELVEGKSFVIRDMIDLKDVNITIKLIDMFRSLHVQALESSDVSFMESLRKLVDGSGFCEASKIFIGRPRMDSNHDLLTQSLQMFNDLCGISTS